jgi:hypothetical protein
LRKFRDTLLRMPPFNFIPIPTHPVRDPNFVTPDEAAKVAAALLAAPDGSTIIVQADGSQITGVQQIPQAPNLYPDGRIFVVLNFAMPRTVTNSQGRQQVVTVPFSEVAGLLLDSVGKAGQSFKFNAESTGVDSWTGDVEMEGA